VAAVSDKQRGVTFTEFETGKNTFTCITKVYLTCEVAAIAKEGSTSFWESL